MKKSYPLYLLLTTFILTCPGLSPGQTSKVADHDYYFELLTFKSSAPGKTYLEILCQIPTQGLRFSRSEVGYRADYRMAITLNNLFGHKVDWESYTGVLDIPDLREQESLPPEILKFPFVIEPGQYIMEIQFTDLQTSENFKIQQEIYVRGYLESNLQLSDLQVSSSISYSKDVTRAVKNNWRIEPNVTRTFATDQDVIYVYAELYAQAAANLEKGLLTTFCIRDLAGRELTRTRTSNKKFGERTVLVGRLPIQKLASGDYELVVRVSDLDSGAEAEKSIFFNIEKPVVRFSGS